MLAIVFGFWYGSQLVLNTQYPALAVVSESMLPTLNVGDVIIVQGVPAAQINANYTTGDIIVYRSPYDPEMRIVHRAVKKELVGNSYVFTTKGDNNPGSDSPFSESYLIGKVIARIPYVGNFALFINTLGNFYFFIILIIIIVNILLSLFLGTDEEKESLEEEPHEKKKLFWKIDTKMISLLILNVLLIGFLIFNLWGSFAFWQPGAETPSQIVTIHGMYSDLQYHMSFKTSHNNVSEAILSQGFLTYQIDCRVNGLIRPGVPTFSWMQTSILLLLTLNLWMLSAPLQLGKRLKQALKLNSLYK
jgi:signal peptidase I